MEIRSTILAELDRHGFVRTRPVPLTPTAETALAPDQLVRSSLQPLIPEGMGLRRPKTQKQSTWQPCCRADDVENIGADGRHLSLFEMAGGVAFDTIGHDAMLRIVWAILSDLGVDRDALWVTVYDGDPAKADLPADHATVQALAKIGVDTSHVVGLMSWRAATWHWPEPAPLGFICEFFVDRGAAYGPADSVPGGDNDRFLEIGAAIFNQLWIDTEDHVGPPHQTLVGFGIGVERIAVVANRCESVFETDGLRAIISAMRARWAPRADAAEVDRALHVLADHGRALAYMLSQDVGPDARYGGPMYRDLAANVARHGRTLGLAAADLKLLPALVADLETVRDPAADLAIGASALNAFGAWLVGQERSEATRSRDSTAS
jgi:alanyl-tRNA synthetase